MGQRDGSTRNGDERSPRDRGERSARRVGEDRVIDRHYHFYLALNRMASALPSSHSLDALQRATLERRLALPHTLSDDFLDASSPDFAEQSARWSTFEAPTFQGVFIPKSEAELTAGLEFLTSSNISFLTKSDGHGYSITISQLQNGVMIIMENLN
ncbi:hypothetical protein GGS21DRAFT_493608 [Xylaria nigripes]|nr:hypothetical protein GGS21DRAFT_493608 [Xylaria nigripes]